MEQIGKKRFAPGKGVTKLPPKKGVKRFLFILSTHFWQLVSLNLLFLLFCVPVVTIPAALCGMNRVLITLVRDGNCFLWNDFVREFKGNLFKSIPFGILFAFFILDSYYFFSFAAAPGDRGTTMLAAAAGFLFLGFAVVFSSFVFVFLPTLALPNRFIARNAFILMLTEWKTSLLILGSTTAMTLVTAAFFPFTIILLLFNWFSLSQLIVCTVVNESLERRIIAPYERKQSEQAS